MEFILELLFDIIVEGSFELVSAKKIPTILRFLAGLVCCVVLVGLLVVFIGVSIGQFQDGNAGAGAVFAAMSIGYVILVFYVLRKKFKEYKKNAEKKRKNLMERTE